MGYRTYLPKLSRAFMYDDCCWCIPYLLYGDEQTRSGHAVLQGNIKGRGHLEGRGNFRMLLKVFLCCLRDPEVHTACRSFTVASIVEKWLMESAFEDLVELKLPRVVSISGI